MTKQIPSFDEIHGPPGRDLTEYVDENIPALWNAVPETILNIQNTGTFYTGEIEDWGPSASINYYPPNKLLWFTPHVPNELDAKLSISGLLSIPLTLTDSLPVPPGQLLAGSTYLLRVASTGLSLETLYIPTAISDISASAFQWQMALSAVNSLTTIRDSIPADIANPVNIQWFAAGTVREDDAVWTHTQGTLGYSDAQMLTLFSSALSLPA